MGKQGEPTDPRQRILDVALRIFAHRGYAGASIQDIVDKAGVTKPTLYYHFKSKEGLFQALVDHAADERFGVMREAAEKHQKIEAKLVAMTDALIQHASERRDLMRLIFSYWFGPPGEIPRSVHCKKGMRIREYVDMLVKQGIESGDLDKRYASMELVSAFMSQIFIYSMSQIVDFKLKQKSGLPKRIVRLFLEGAEPRRQRARRAA
jgi:AcrR family transcriptional regulator